MLAANTMKKEFDAVDGCPEDDPLTTITSVALHLFGSQGFIKTTTRDIAIAANMAPGSLYTHIQSKEDLLRIIVLDGIDLFRAAIRPYSIAKNSPAKRLRDMITTHVEILAEYPELSQVMLRQWRFLEADNLAVVINWQREYQNLFVKVVEDGIESGDFRPGTNPRILVLTILGALNWTPEWFSPTQKLSASEVGYHLADTLLRGVSKTRTSREHSPD